MVEGARAPQSQVAGCREGASRNTRFAAAAAPSTACGGPPPPLRGGGMRAPSPASLPPLRHHEQARKPQQHTAIGLRLIFGGDRLFVACEIFEALGLIERIEERPKPRALQPFDDGGGACE